MSTLERSVELLLMGYDAPGCRWTWERADILRDVVLRFEEAMKRPDGEFRRQERHMAMQARVDELLTKWRRADAAAYRAAAEVNYLHCDYSAAREATR